MTTHIARMRMFAGPNGSGKSTIKTVLPPELVGVYVNPDDIQKDLTASGTLDLTAFCIIATDDPEINVSRVQNRVGLGGHPVPREKIIARYKRSLGYLLAAIRKSDRAYLFDNSGIEPIWLAEVTDGTKLKLKTETIPEWLNRAVLDKLPGK